MTFTWTVVPAVPGGTMATCALKGPEPESAAGFTVTCKVFGKLPDVGFNVIQSPPLLVVAEAVNEVMLELLVERDTSSVTGIVLPEGKLKLKEFGLAVIVPDPVDPAVLVSSTTSVTDCDPEMMVMKPTSGVTVESAGFTDTLTWSGVVPLVGVTDSQLVSDENLIVMLAGPTVEVILRVCAGGVVPFGALKKSSVGLMTSVPFCARAVSEKHTSDAATMVK